MIEKNKYGGKSMRNVTSYADSYHLNHQGSSVNN